MRFTNNPILFLSFKPQSNGFVFVSMHLELEKKCHALGLACGSQMLVCVYVCVVLQQAAHMNVKGKDTARDADRT